MSRKRIYVGNLPNDAREADVKDLFRKYGDIEFLDLKNRSGGPVFAFLDFADERCACCFVFYLHLHFSVTPKMPSKDAMGTILMGLVSC
jgi:hypothetical protein